MLNNVFLDCRTSPYVSQRAQVKQGYTGLTFYSGRPLTSRNSTDQKRPNIRSRSSPHRVQTPDENTNEYRMRLFNKFLGCAGSPLLPISAFPRGEVYCALY